ncbi:MAG: hypothetical protein QW702_02170 [Candidatus Bathyarchaeia archaeon]
MFTEKPLEIKILEKYIEDWKEFSNGFLVIPKKGMFFNKLFIRSRRIFMDRAFEFSALIEVARNKKVNKRFKNFLCSLMGLSCELHWDGVLFKKPRFESLKILNTLQTFIPTLKIDRRLIDALNGSNSIVEMLRKVHPDNLYITLASLSSFQGFEFSYDTVETIMERCLNVDNVTWIIDMDKMISRTPNYKKTFEETIRLINMVSEVIIGITNLYLNYTGSPRRDLKKKEASENDRIG